MHRAESAHPSVPVAAKEKDLPNKGSDKQNPYLNHAPAEANCFLSPRLWRDNTLPWLCCIRSPAHQPPQKARRHKCNQPPRTNQMEAPPHEAILSSSNTVPAPLPCPTCSRAGGKRQHRHAHKISWSPCCNIDTTSPAPRTPQYTSRRGRSEVVFALRASSWCLASCSPSGLRNKRSFAGCRCYFPSFTHRNPR